MCETCRKHRWWKTCSCRHGPRHSLFNAENTVRRRDAEAARPRNIFRILVFSRVENGQKNANALQVHFASFGVEWPIMFFMNTQLT